MDSPDGSVGRAPRRPSNRLTMSVLAVFALGLLGFSLAVTGLSAYSLDTCRQIQDKYSGNECDLEVSMNLTAAWLHLPVYIAVFAYAISIRYDAVHIASKSVLGACLTVCLTLGWRALFRGVHFSNYDYYVDYDSSELDSTGQNAMRWAAGFSICVVADIIMIGMVGMSVRNASTSTFGSTNHPWWRYIICFFLAVGVVGFGTANYGLFDLVDGCSVASDDPMCIQFNLSFFTTWLNALTYLIVAGVMIKGKLAQSKPVLLPTLAICVSLGLWEAHESYRFTLDLDSDLIESLTSQNEFYFWGRGLLILVGVDLTQITFIGMHSSWNVVEKPLAADQVISSSQMSNSGTSAANQINDEFEDVSEPSQPNTADTEVSSMLTWFSRKALCYIMYGLLVCGLVSTVLVEITIKDCMEDGDYKGWRYHEYLEVPRFTIRYQLMIYLFLVAYATAIATKLNLGFSTFALRAFLTSCIPLCCLGAQFGMFHGASDEEVDLKHFTAGFSILATVDFALLIILGKFCNNDGVKSEQQ